MRWARRVLHLKVRQRVQQKWRRRRRRRSRGVQQRRRRREEKTEKDEEKEEEKEERTEEQMDKIREPLIKSACPSSNNTNLTNNTIEYWFKTIFVYFAFSIYYYLWIVVFLFVEKKKH